MSKISLGTVVNHSSQSEEKYSEEFKKFINAINADLKDQTEIRTRYSQCEPLKLQLSFEHLIKILHHVAVFQNCFINSLATLSKNKKTPSVYSHPHLPRDITLFSDDVTKKTVLIIFLGILLADQRPDTQLDQRGQTKSGSPCYAITLVEDKLKFLEQYTVRSHHHQRINSGHRISTLVNSPYIIKYKLLKFPNSELGLLSNRGLFRLVDTKHFKHFLKYDDLLTICYSLLRGVCDLHRAKITHRDILANWMVFKDTRTDTFYVKMIDFDFAEQTAVDDIKHFNHDLRDMGIAIVHRIFNDNYGELNQYPQEIYRDVAFGIQELANLLLTSSLNQEKSFLTAEHAFQFFMKIINPIHKISPITFDKIQQLHYVLEHSNQSHSHFCVRDAEYNAQSSAVSSAPLTTADAKEFVPDTWLSIRRALSKNTLPPTPIHPYLNLGNNIYPLGYAITRKKWDAVRQLLDSFTSNRHTLNPQTFLLTFNRFPTVNCGLLNFIIEEKKLDFQVRKDLIQKFINLQADVFYQSTLLGSPLQSIIRIMGSKKLTEIECWELIELIYPERIFLDPYGIALMSNSNDPAVKILLKLSMESKKINYTKITLSQLKSEDLDTDLLLDILMLAMNCKQVEIFNQILIKKLVNPTFETLSWIIQAKRCQKIPDFKADFKQQAATITAVDLLGEWEVAFKTKSLGLMCFLQSYFRKMPPSEFIKMPISKDLAYIAYSCFVFIDNNKTINSLSNTVIIHLIKNLDPIYLPLLIEKAMLTNNWRLINIFLESKVIGINYIINKKSIFEWSVEYSNWDGILDHIEEKKLEKSPSVVTKVINRFGVNDSVLSWAIKDKHVRAVQTLCENGANVDEVRYTTNKKPRKKPGHIFELIKELKLLPNPPQKELFEIIKCLLKRSNQINFDDKFYKPNVMGNTKTKHMSHLMCYLIEHEEVAVIKELILNNNFVPIIRVHYQLYNFIDYAIMKNKLNVIALFSEEIGNLKEFVLPTHHSQFDEMENNLAISKFITSLQNQDQSSGVEDKKTEVTTTLPSIPPVLFSKSVVNENVIIKNTIDDFKLLLQTNPDTVNSVTNYSSRHHSKPLSLIDLAARQQKWEYVLELLDKGANYDFIMEFGEGPQKQQCSFFHFVLNKCYKGPVVREIVSRLLAKTDLDVYTPSSSNDSVTSSIQRLVKKDPLNTPIYEGFKKRIVSLWENPSFSFSEPATPVPDEKISLDNPFTIFNGQNILSKRKQPELPSKSSHTGGAQLKKINSVKSATPSFAQQTECTTGLRY